MEVNTFNYINQQIKIIRIGTGSRDDDLKFKIREGTPGPGMYGLTDGNIGPKYKLYLCSI